MLCVVLGGSFCKIIHTPDLIARTWWQTGIITSILQPNDNSYANRETRPLDKHKRIGSAAHWLIVCIDRSLLFAYVAIVFELSESFPVLYLPPLLHKKKSTIQIEVTQFHHCNLYHRKMSLLTIRLQLLLVGGLCLSLGGPLNINYSSIYGLPNASMSPCPRHFVIEFVCPPKWQLHVIRIGHECDDRCKSSGVLVLERWMSGQAQELNLRMCMDGNGMRRPVASTVDMGGGRIYCSCRKLSKCRMVCLYYFWMCHEDVLYRCPIVPTWILTLSSTCMSGWQQ